MKTARQETQQELVLLCFQAMISQDTWVVLGNHLYGSAEVT